MIDPQKYGISFSLKQCRNFDLNPQETLDWLLAQGWRRFRLMSYWDECEKSTDQYDFSQLDWQLARISEAGGEVTMCLGVKQPRWPEYHWPDWAWQLPKEQRNAALVTYVGQTVAHYKRWDVITSWQLENEALLKGFGKRIDIDRKRLRAEYTAVRQLDQTRPILMSTSNSWGIPLRKPLPSEVGFSYYLTKFSKGKYHSTVQSAWLHRMRRSTIRILLGKPVFIHELQCEPWGSKAIWEMDNAEQDKSMSTQQITKNIAAAKKIKVYPIDFWGAEWWYWRSKQDDDTIWRTVETELQS